MMRRILLLSILVLAVLVAGIPGATRAEAFSCNRAETDNCACIAAAYENGTDWQACHSPWRWVVPLGLVALALGSLVVFSRRLQRPESVDTLSEESPS